MVAPLIIAGARVLGPQLAKQGAMRAAGAQLAKREAGGLASNQLAKKAPNMIGKQGLGSVKAPTQTKGPVSSATDVQNKNIQTTKQPSLKQTNNNISDTPPQANAPEKLGGPLYLLVLFVVIFKDVLDGIFQMLAFVFDILLLTLPLGMFIEIISTISDFIILIITQGYLMSNGVPVKKDKMMIQGITTTLEAIPFLGALPFGTISFVYIVNKVNKEREQAYIAEQNALNEQFMQAQNEVKEQVVDEYNNQDTSRRYLSEEREKINSSENTTAKNENKDWKNMVDQSPQNITKSLAGNKLAYN